MFCRSAIATILASISVAAAISGFEEVETALGKRQQYTGEATVYSVSSGASGSCETQLNNGEYFVALSNYWQDGESPGPKCGDSITLTNTGSPYSGVGGTGNTVTVTVTDTCPSCSQNHLDLSVAAWNSLTSGSSYSVTDITWSFNS